MLSSSVLAPYVGFTQEEVISLCERFGHNYEEVKKWYDGYRLGQYHINNPNAVVNLMLIGEFTGHRQAHMNLLYLLSIKTLMDLKPQ